MGFTEAVTSVFRNYATFSGRAPRSEYWWFVLFTFIALGVIGVLDGMIFGYTATSTPPAEGVGFSYAVETPGYLTSLWLLGTLLPTLAVTVRRLHDTGRSGWWILIQIVPLVGFILMIIWTVTAGDNRANDYGPDPLDGGRDASRIPRVPRGQ